MSISYINLLLLFSAPWMGNAMPAESIEPVSRESRQIMFPYGVVPWQQPTDSYNYGSFIHQLHPAMKHRLLEALVTVTEETAENLSLPPSYKVGTKPIRPKPLNSDPNASDDELFQRISQFVPYSAEELKEMQSRFGLEATIALIVRILVTQIVTNVIGPMISDWVAGFLENLG